MPKDSAMTPIGRQGPSVTSALSYATLAKRVTAVGANMNGPIRLSPMHRDTELTKCDVCGRTGVMRENGDPANWNRDLQGVLKCPGCWGPAPEQSPMPTVFKLRTDLARD